MRVVCLAVSGLLTPVLMFALGRVCILRQDTGPVTPGCTGRGRRGHTGRLCTLRHGARETRCGLQLQGCSAAVSATPDPLSLISLRVWPRASVEAEDNIGIRDGERRAAKCYHYLEGSIGPNCSIKLERGVVYYLLTLVK